MPVQPDLMSFLQLLTARKLSNVRIVGGAVRDFLLSVPSSDIDIAVQLALPSPDPARPIFFADDPRPPKILTDNVRGLLLALGVTADDIGASIPFGNLTIDVLGLRAVRASGGELLPDIFVDQSGGVFGALPELTINRILMTPTMGIGPKSAILDLERRIARLVDAPLEIRLRQVVRAIRDCQRFSLRLTDSTRARLKSHLSALHSSKSLLGRELLEEDTPGIVGEVLGGVASSRFPHPPGPELVERLESIVDAIPRVSGIGGAAQ